MLLRGVLVVGLNDGIVFFGLITVIDVLDPDITVTLGVVVVIFGFVVIVIIIGLLDTVIFVSLLIGILILVNDNGSFSIFVI